MDLNGRAGVPAITLGYLSNEEPYSRLIFRKAEIRQEYTMRGNGFTMREIE